MLKEHNRQHLKNIFKLGTVIFLNNKVKTALWTKALLRAAIKKPKTLV